MIDRFLSQVWRQPRRRKWLVYGGTAIALYLVVGFFAVPALLRWQLQKRLPALTHRQASIRQVRCNPLALSLTVNGLSLTETNGQPFASFQELYVNFQLSSLVRFAWTFDEIRLQRPRAQLTVGKDRRLNWANLFEPSSPATAKPAATTPTSSGLPRLVIFRVNVTNGVVAFSDLSLSKPFQTTYEPINLSLHDFVTKPGQDSRYSFEASSDQIRQIAWSGTVTAHPPDSRGALTLAGLQLPKLGPYLEQFTRIHLAEGILGVQGQYQAGLGTNGLSLTASNLAVRLENLRLTDPDTKLAILDLPSMALQGGSMDWGTRRIQGQSLEVQAPALVISRQADGGINPVTLLRPATAEPTARTAPGRLATNAPASAPWALALDVFQMTDGSLQLTDLSEGRNLRSLLKPMTVRVRNFSTAAGAVTDLEMAFTSEAAEGFSLRASGSLNPMASRGQMTLASLTLPKYQSYLPRSFRGTLAQGKADLSLDFLQSLEGGELRASVTNTTLSISDLQLQSPREQETILAMPSLALQNVAADLASQEVQVRKISSAGTVILVRREVGGRLNLADLWAAATNSAATSEFTGTNRTGGWSLILDGVALEDWKIRLIDADLPKAGALDLDQLSLALQSIRFPGNTPIDARLTARVNTRGTLAAQGQVWPDPISATGQVEIAGLELRDFQPWTESQVKLNIEQGTFQAKARAQFTSASGAAPQLRVAGDFDVISLATVDQTLFKELVRWDKLAVQGFAVDLAPKKASIDQVTFSGMNTAVIIGTNKQLNLLSIFPARTNTAASSSGGATPRPPAVEARVGSFQLGQLKFENSGIQVTDQSVQPPGALAVQQLQGSIQGLSTEPGSTAEIAFTGRFDEGAPFGLHGRLSPLSQGLELDLTFTNQALQLTPFTPYLEKYAGHPLQKGRLALDLTYSIHDHQLKAKNLVRVDQLLLGARNDSPDATKLPVKLAIALLRDSNGQINLDLPVEGRLDDPEFSVGPVVVKVLVNIIAKAATSPFKLLGALVGGGEELSFVDFQPGLPQFVPAETNKLDRLLEALEKRPTLSLEIAGSLDRVADRDALALELVKERVKRSRLQELSALGRSPSSSEFQPDPADYERLLRVAMVEVCGTNLTAALREFAAHSAANTNSVAAPRPIQGPGLLRRVTSWFKPREERTATALAHRNAKSDELLLKQNPDLGGLTTAEMELLLAAKTEVPSEKLLALSQSRAKAVQAYLLSSGRLTAERLFLLTPKSVEAAQGGARVNLSLN